LYILNTTTTGTMYCTAGCDMVLCPAIEMGTYWRRIK
jgi:hypothetical protein